MLAQQIRKIILQQSKRAQVGHIGCALSVADIIASLYGETLQISRTDDPERDRFVLSKGHAALGLYAALFLKGWITQEMLESFHTDGSVLGVHPEHIVPGVDFSTGSLGHGLSIGAGAALAARLQKSKRRVYVLLSDAECNEGSTWEAVMFAAHHGLTNLTAVVDLNGQQALGYTRDVLDLAGMAERWRSFGWKALEVDGHNPEELSKAFNPPISRETAPRVVVARTVFGKGVSFMEGQLKWHYLPMSDEQFQLAIREVG